MARIESSEVVCPYYRGESRKYQQIYCEGFFPSSSVSLNFANNEEKMRWRSCFCDRWDYGTCPIAQWHNEKNGK